MSTVPAFLSIFEQPLPDLNQSLAHVSIERALSASEGSERTIKSEVSSVSIKKSLKKSDIELSETKRRFVEPPKKTSRMGTLRRLTKKYSKKCKQDNLLHLLNWKDESWTRKIGLDGEIFDTKLANHVLPSGEKCEHFLHNVVDSKFPETIHGSFTNSLFDFDFDSKLETFKTTPKLKTEVLTEGNVVQMWKLLDKKGGIWHVSCIIWHNDEPYSFGFDGHFLYDSTKMPNLSLKSPNAYLEVALSRQKNKNPTGDFKHGKKPKFVELFQ